MCYHVGIKSLPNTIDLKGQEDPIRSPKKSAAVMISVTRLGDLLDFGHLFEAIGNN